MGSLEPHTKSWVIESPNFLTRCLLGIYLLFIFYGSLYPAYPFRLPNDSILSLLTVGWISKTYQFDIFQNFLFYMPLGALWIYRSPSLLCATFTLSTFLEVLQSYLPMRTPSILDVGLNVSGALLAYALFKEGCQHLIMRGIQYAHHSQYQVWIGGGILLLFLLVQWAPFLPTLEPSHIRRLLDPMLTGLKNPSSLNIFAIAKYVCWGFAIYIGLKLVFKLEHPLLCWLGFTGLVFCIKSLMMTRVVSLEAVLGILISCITIMLIRAFLIRSSST
ncbi:MAG: VanZ family protein [Gammaproteobacteria bacterium]